ncbi:hypothetical protein GCM10025858_31350 [Alicyclobacillus sacchari]|nr:hypothetical protein GCM10025858_31350 [Alicyclobacillus sacchari]
MEQAHRIDGKVVCDPVQVELPVTKLLESLFHKVAQFGGKAATDSSSS